MKERDIAALIAFIQSRQKTHYEWGRRKNDCVSFVLDAVKAENGRGRASDLRWSNQTSALRLIKKLGGLEKAFDRYFQRIPPSKAMRGDIGGVPDEALGIHPMIVEGDTLVGPGDRGNKRVPRRDMIMAWSATLPRPKASK